ncbi:hypothetical protein GCM10009789_02490 [Kribbella sancticallisti]|uniref:Uncharacterized protein n=1 Tax=Kribbella sancticallisti TaxID=460087 RepID=A0ABN2C715_9ACTN
MHATATLEIAGWGGPQLGKRGQRQYQHDHQVGEYKQTSARHISKVATPSRSHIHSEVEAWSLPVHRTVDHGNPITADDRRCLRSLASEYRRRTPEAKGVSSCCRLLFPPGGQRPRPVS